MTLTTRRLHILAIFTFVHTCTLTGVLLSANDRTRRIEYLEDELRVLRSAYSEPIKVDDGPLVPLIPLLVNRTEYLRTILRVLIREGYEAKDSARVRLPDPPPGWDPITLSSDESKPGKHSGRRAWRNDL